MKKTAFLTAIGIGVMSVGLASASPTEAVAQVREHSNKIIQILNQANGKNDAQIRKQLEDYVTPYTDFNRMTQLAVGNPWRQANPAQRQALIEGFKNKIRGTYTGTMAKFKNAKVVVDDKTIAKEGGIVVKTAISSAGGKPVNVDFTMRKDGSKYRIYNVALEGASLVTVYRNQFGETVKAKGINGLVEELNKSK